MRLNLLAWYYILLIYQEYIRNQEIAESDEQS